MHNTCEGRIYAVPPSFYLTCLFLNSTEMEELPFHYLIKVWNPTQMKMKSLRLINGNHPGSPTHHTTNISSVLSGQQYVNSQRSLLLSYTHAALASDIRFQSYLPQTACQTVFQSMDPLPCHRIFCVLLFVITFYNYKIFKVIKHDKQHFLPCQVFYNCEYPNPFTIASIANPFLQYGHSSLPNA